jgi:hypothetical protein
MDGMRHGLNFCGNPDGQKTVEEAFMVDQHLFGRICEKFNSQ